MKPLTEQEIRIVNLMIQGRGFDMIAEKIHIEHSTLRVHISNIREKLLISTTNPHNLRAAMARYRAADHPIKGAKLSPGERRIVEMRANGTRFRGICLLLGCAMSTALNLSSRACRKLGVDGSNNPARLRAALDAVDQPAAEENPLTHEQKLITMEDF